MAVSGPERAHRDDPIAELAVGREPAHMLHPPRLRWPGSAHLRSATGHAADDAVHRRPLRRPETGQHQSGLPRRERMDREGEVHPAIERLALLLQCLHVAHR
jgi:hypothetical protein